MVMGTQASSVYQQVMEKTKGLLFKCQVLEQNYEKKKKSGTNDGYVVTKVRKLDHNFYIHTCNVEMFVWGNVIIDRDEVESEVNIIDVQ